MMLTEMYKLIDLFDIINEDKDEEVLNENEETVVQSAIQPNTSGSSVIILDPSL